MTDKSMEQRLYPEAAKAPEPVLPTKRPATMEDRLYGATHYQRLEGLSALAAAGDHDPATVEHNFTSAMREANFQRGDASEIARVFESTYKEPVTAETVKKWQTESDKTLGQTLGAGYKAAVLRAHRFLEKRTPDFYAAVNGMGLMAHPKLLQIFIEQARREGA